MFEMKIILGKTDQVKKSSSCRETKWVTENIIDPKVLHKAVKRPHYAHLTAEDMFSEMSGAKYFTKLDAINGYWQIKLDEESSKLLTFNSPFGRHQLCRISYGIHSASDVCQHKIAKIIDGIVGAANSQDDIIIWGSTQQ